jgi:hypothetical protein
MNYKVLVAAALAAVVVQASALDESLPSPWFKNGQQPALDACKAGVDTDLEKRGTRNITLRCEEAPGGGFVGVMQNFAASDYLGKRLRFSALVKVEGVEDWAGLWMRVDDKDKPSAAFDNMQNRPIKGSSDWTPYSVVLDASPNAQGVFFGVILIGQGQVWVSDLRLEVVAEYVMPTSRTLQSRPGNLELAR